MALDLFLTAVATVFAFISMVGESHKFSCFKSPLSISTIVISVA